MKKNTSYFRSYFIIIKYFQQMQSINQNKERTKILFQKIAAIRLKISQLSFSNKIPADEIELIMDRGVDLMPQIRQYIKIFPQSVELIQEKRVQDSIFQINPSGKAQPLKINLHLWQIFNFILVKSTEFYPEFLQFLFPLFNIDVSYQITQSNNSIRNGLIYLHNLLARLVQNSEIIQSNQQLILNTFTLVLTHHFQRYQKKFKQLPLLFDNQKGQGKLLIELEWLCLIFMQLFNNKYFPSKKVSVIKLVIQLSKHQKMPFYLLHMIGNYFQEMVDQRVTTELVSGFQCKINDIKQMYQNTGKSFVEMKISCYELDFILNLFKQTITTYKSLVQKYLKVKIFTPQQNKQIEQINKNWLYSTEILTEICHILNNVLFIGGYNNKLQDEVIQILMQRDKILLDYLQISYLLYRNIEATRHQAKVQLVVQMQEQSKKKLLEVTAIEVEDIQKINMKDLNLQKMLAQGQLVSILRLLANLVHINRRSQIPFQNQPKYLHMILSLTHDSVSQVTMKEWAVMFIRNVSEWSQKLRKEIGQIKVEMKVE